MEHQSSSPAPMAAPPEKTKEFAPSSAASQAKPAVPSGVTFRIPPRAAPEKESFRFRDADNRQILLELLPSGIVHCFVNGRHKVNKVSSIWAEGRALHIAGGRLLSSSCVAIVPEAGYDGMTPDEVIVAAMELFGKRTPSPNVPEGSTRLVVSIISARGLRDADGLPGQGSSDPYCVLEIIGKPGSRLCTKFIKNTLNPEWNYIAELAPWIPGDTLEFNVWDKDWCSRDDFLGKYELRIPKSPLPTFEGEVPLDEAGKGIQAFLRLRVLSGTREERERKRMKSELRKATLPEELDSERLQEMLKEAQDMGLSASDRASAQSFLAVLRALHEACLKREQDRLRVTIQDAMDVGLGAHTVCTAAQEVLAEVEVRDRIAKALDERNSMAELQSAITAAQEIGIDDADYGDGPVVLFKLKALVQACAGEEDARRVIQALEDAASLRAWPEYVEAREFGRCIVVSQLAEACRAPTVDALHDALAKGKELRVPEDKLAPAKKMLEALVHLNATVELSPGSEARVAPLLSAITTAKDLGTDEISCPDFAAAMKRLRELAAHNLDQAKSRAAIKAALEVAEEAGLSKGETSEAKEVLELLEGLERACLQCTVDALRSAITAADFVDFDKGGCAEYQRAKQQLAAHEMLAEARKPGADPALLTAAIEAAKEAGLSPADYESAGDALSRARLEEAIREKCTKAEARASCDELERAVDAAQLVGLQELEECQSARRMLQRLRLAEELRQACEPPLRAERLRRAWEACQRAGLEDRGRSLPDEVREILDRGRQLVVDEDRRDAARSKLEAAIESGLIEHLAKALECARSAGLPEDEIARAESKKRREEERLEDLRREEARRRAEEARIEELERQEEERKRQEEARRKEEERREEEGRRREEEEKNKAKAALDKACQALTRKALRSALAEASNAGLPDDDQSEAQALFDALEHLHAATRSGGLAQLRAALEGYGTAAVQRSSEYAECKEKLKAEEAKAKERERKEKADRELKAKVEKEQKAARKCIEQARADGGSEALRAALQQGQAAKLPREELESVERELKVALEEEEERFGVVRELLTEALRDGASIQQIEGAVLAAENARMPSGDAMFKQVRELLAQKREALRMLNSALNAKELKAALEAARHAGLAGSPEYLDAKTALDSVKDAAKRSQHLERTREELEEAVRSGKKDRLEKAIRQARLLNMDSSERLLRQAAEKLKEVMVEFNERLVKKVELGLRERTLDRKRLDDMEEVKEELLSALKVSKDVGVDDVDLEDIERLRKRVHNIVEDLKGSIRVFCRMRPLSKRERGQGDASCVRQPDPMTIEVLEEKTSLEGRKKTDAHTFHFDAVFSPGAQDAIFADCKELVQSALDGYNVTIFAYGQTGAGKTYTMTGEPGNDGVAPSTIDEIFSVMELNKSRFEYAVTASVGELYCNNFVDLLRKSSGKAPEAPIEIRWDKDAGEVVIDGLSEETAKSPKALRALLSRGQEARKVAQTQMNHESSRSHLIMMIKVIAENRDTGERLKGKLVLVDLAGSERIKKSKAGGQQQTEAIEINKSLTALVDVIEALVQNQKERNVNKQRLIPYRNHKLTQLLQDTLGGSAKALMFVNCSPANSNLQETMSSLRYAARAKTITNARSTEAAHGDPEEAAARSRPLMARLRTSRSQQDLSRFKTFHDDDDGASHGRGRKSSADFASTRRSTSADTLGTSTGSWLG